MKKFQRKRHQCTAYLSMILLVDMLPLLSQLFLSTVVQGETHLISIMKILSTGGAGFIGSHTVLALLGAGYDVVVVDNLSNSSPEALERVEEISGRSITFCKGDITDFAFLDRVFQEHEIDAVIHFAGFKAVGESVAKPLKYYHNNVTGTIVLCEVMIRHGVKNIVFSSSATVYGSPEKMPIREDYPISPMNPYGQSKAIVERLLQDLHVSDNAWNIGILRYFNPIGAHESGQIGEDPFDIPNNLLPYISQVAVGRLELLSVFGDDYPTLDGTGVRDYIHVVDLADGHLKMLDYLFASKPGVFACNLGTGRGNSVLEVIDAFEKACGQKIPYQITDRRPGDAASSYADPTLAEKTLGWKTIRNLEVMCEDIWRWQRTNPQGYR